MIGSNVTQITVNATETIAESMIGMHPLREYIMQQAMTFGYFMLAVGFVCGIVFGIGVYRIHLRRRG